MKTLEDYVRTYGPVAGPKLYRTLRSRAAYKGVSTRRRHQIEALTGRPYRPRRRPAAPANDQAFLPLDEPLPRGEAVRQVEPSSIAASD